jgi:hypothetical protein
MKKVILVNWIEDILFRPHSSELVTLDWAPACGVRTERHWVAYDPDSIQKLLFLPGVLQMPIEVERLEAYGFCEYEKPRTPCPTCGRAFL